MKKVRAALLATAVALATPGADAAAAGSCDPGLRGAAAQRVEGTHYVLDWRTPTPIRQGEFFTVDIAVCARDGSAPPAALRIDARMPAHRHGMNYRPTVATAGAGRFAARGLMLHMPGEWELSFDVNPGATPRETLRSAVTLQ